VSASTSQTRLPARLRRLRDARGWTTYHLADRLGISPATLDRVERGEAELPRRARPRAEALLTESAPGAADPDSDAFWLALMRLRLRRALGGVEREAVRALESRLLEGAPDIGRLEDVEIDAELLELDSFELLQGRWKRKLLGQYYTPRAIVEQALDAVWPERHGSAPRILDPACGCGAFLLAAAERLLRGAGAEAPGTVLARIAGSLCGLDIDPLAAVSARVLLAERLAPWISEALREAGADAVPLPRVAIGDFLDGPPLEGEFDLVAGNPPYLESKRMPAEMKQRLRRDHPHSARGAFDLYLPFLAAALDRVAGGGALAFVLPNKFCVARAARPVRQAILARFADVRLLDVSAGGDFEKAAVYPVVLAVRDVEPADGFEARRLARTPDQVFHALPDDGPGRALFLRLERVETRLGEYLEPRWTVSFHRAGLRDRYFSEQPRGRFPRKILGAPRFGGNREVQRHRLGWKGWWIDYDRERAHGDGNLLPPTGLFDPPTIAVCQNSKRLRAAVDLEGYVLKDTFLALKPARRCLAESLDLHALCAVLNSAVLHFYYVTLYGMTHVAGGYLHFLGQYLKHLPLVVPRGEAAVELGELAREAAACEGDERFGELDQRLEAAVGRLYGLSGTEQEIVLGALPTEPR